MILLAEASNSAQIVTAICGTIAAIAVPYLAYLTVKLTVAQKVAAVKVAQVAEVLDQTTHDNTARLGRLTEVALSTQKTGESIHTLVNSATGAMLETIMLDKKRIAESGDKGDVLAFEQSQRRYDDHIERQKVVDDAAGLPAKM